MRSTSRGHRFPSALSWAALAVVVGISGLTSGQVWVVHEHGAHGSHIHLVSRKGAAGAASVSGHHDHPVREKNLSDDFAPDADGSSPARDATSDGGLPADPERGLVLSFGDVFFSRCRYPTVVPLERPLGDEASRFMSDVGVPLQTGPPRAPDWRDQASPHSSLTSSRRFRTVSQQLLL